VKPLVLDSLETILEEKPFTKQYYYIAHLLDRILMGKEKDGNHGELVQAFKDDQVFELHLFNEEKELFAARVDGQFIVYKPLLHEAVEGVIIRCYELMPGLLQLNGMVEDSVLEVKEYVSYDEESHMAYVEKTVLYRFIEGRKR
jgi:DNA-directed RNA polymerase subunit E'/Rpb7